MTWFVARKSDGSLASIHRDHMPDYNDEALADSDPEIRAFLSPPPSPVANRAAWLAFQADELARQGDMIGALSLKLLNP